MLHMSVLNYLDVVDPHVRSAGNDRHGRKGENPHLCYGCGTTGGHVRIRRVLDDFGGFDHNAGSVRVVHIAHLVENVHFVLLCPICLIMAGHMQYGMLSLIWTTCTDIAEYVRFVSLFEVSERYRGGCPGYGRMPYFVRSVHIVPYEHIVPIVVPVRFVQFDDYNRFV